MAVETLRPNAVGDSAQFLRTPGTGEANWQDVDEASPDDDTTYVYRSNLVLTLIDLYNIADPTFADSVTISNVTVYWRCNRYSLNYKNGYYGIKSGGTEYWSGVITFGSSWTDYYTVYTTDPKTGGAWTKAAITALQVGIKIISGTSQGMKATQIYVEIDYTAVPPRHGFVNFQDPGIV